MKRSGDLDFSNAIKADLDRNVPDSVSIYSLSGQRCLRFQFLEPPPAIGQRDKDAVVIQCFPDRRNRVS
jgi:hypothetical protein